MGRAAAEAEPTGARPSWDRWSSDAGAAVSSGSGSSPATPSRTTSAPSYGAPSKAAARKFARTVSTATGRSRRPASSTSASFDPAHGGEAGRRRGERNAAKLRANAAWKRRNPGVVEPDTYTREIGPKLGAISLAVLMKATGLSRPYCAMIRRGARVPHPRHWEALRVLVT